MKLGRLKYKKDTADSESLDLQRIKLLLKVEKIVGTTHWSNSSWSWNTAKYINLLFSVNRQELPQYWKNYVILLIYMKSDKTNYRIPRHITVINFKVLPNILLSRQTMHANKTEVHVDYNCGTFPTDLLHLSHMRKSVGSQCASTQFFRDFKNLMIWLGGRKG